MERREGAATGVRGGWRPVSRIRKKNMTKERENRDTAPTPGVRAQADPARKMRVLNALARLRPQSSASEDREPRRPRPSEGGVRLVPRAPIKARPTPTERAQVQTQGRLSASSLREARRRARQAKSRRPPASILSTGSGARPSTGGREPDFALGLVRSTARAISGRMDRTHGASVRVAPPASAVAEMVVAKAEPDVGAPGSGVAPALGGDELAGIVM
jgi:hypothetical protein